MALINSTARAPVAITRMSHVVLTVRDLDAAARFYTEVVGLVVSGQSRDALYLRGVEEACHHSLVLRASLHGPVCERIGFRVWSEEDLGAAHDWLAARGCDVRWVEAAHQGRTLDVTDPFGVRLQICATMEVEPRMITRFSRHRGGVAQRLDHVQVLVPDVAAAAAFYMEMGFRLTEYIAPDAEAAPGGVFLQRKGNPHDIVFFRGPGPRLHHFAYVTPDTATMIHACDVAGEMGYGAAVERGPGRHGPGHALYSYMRDPDGHRVELFNTHYQIMDSEIAPVRWHPDDVTISTPWGLPAQESWFVEATCFRDTAVVTPEGLRPPRSLQRVLPAV